MSKVLIVGGRGFLGIHVTRAFARHGHAVQAHSRSTGLDARNEAALVALFSSWKPDIVVNCAGNVGGIEHTSKRLVSVYEDNLLIGFNLIRASVQCGIDKFVNIMPNCTYPGDSEVHSESHWWNGPLHPTVMTYAMPRKALWTQSWAYYQERNFHSIHLVLPNMYGPGMHFGESAHALGALVRKVMDAKAKGTTEIEIWGTGRPVREWLYVEDAAEGILLATEQYDDIEIMNLGRGEGCSIQELAELIAEIARWRGRFYYDAARPDGALCKIFDVSKMRDILHWSPPTGLRDGVEKTVKWFAASTQAQTSVTI